MKYFIILIFLLSLFAKTNHYGDVTNIITIVNVYDGNTFTINIEGWPDIIGKGISVRVKGIDTPEMKSKNHNERILAQKAKKFVVGIFMDADPTDIQLKNIERDKYFRILADVYIGTNNLTDLLIKNGLGKKYYSGTKEKW